MAQMSEIAVFACSMVLRELRSIYRTVCEGIMNLADKFFEMVGWGVRGAVEGNRSEWL